MKILNWIFKILKFIKEFAEIIKWVIIGVLAILAFTGFKSCKNERQDKDNIVTILTSENEIYKTESGKSAIKVKNWIIKYKALDKSSIEITHENNAYLNELSKAKETIKDLEVRLKDVKNYIKTDLIAKDSIKTELIFFDCDSIEIKPIKKKHIKLNFVQRGNQLDITYLYNAEISTVISRKAESKKNGKDHFILSNAGWLWGWEYITQSTVNDPNAYIDNLVEITFAK